MKFRLTYLILAVFCVTAVIPHTAFAVTPKKKTTTQAAPAKKTKKIAPQKHKKVAAVAPKPIVPKYRAALLISSATVLKLSPNESVVLRFGFKNTGTMAWRTRELSLLSPDGALFATSSWASTSTPVRISDAPLSVGRLEFYDVALVAPEQPGTFELRAQLLADDEVVSGSVVSVPIEVLLSETSVTVSQELLPEPNIRVSLGKVEGPTAVRISAGNYNVTLLDGTSIGAISLGDKTVLEYDRAGKTYQFQMNGVTTTSTQPFRLSVIDADSRFVLVDKTDTAQWNKSIVYNEYRGSFELRWSDKIPGVWMVNELPMEQYLKGLIETGNSESMELHKSVYTAARTYAYIHLPDGKRYIDRIWDVHAVWDQYYKGYAAERANPNGIRAVDETRGLLITYDNRPVVTPYFTRSNGMTRGWKAAWGGTDKPWLQPVVAVHDQGKKLWGHGVGMSTQDAKYRVLKDNWTHEQILTYYYTGVQLKRVYN